MKLRKTIGFCLSMLLMAGSAAAQQVNVTGMGADRESALRDVMRMGVENVVGTFVDSKVLVDRSVVVMDEINTNSRGFVRDIKVLNEGQRNGSYVIDALVDVDTNPNGQLMSKLQLVMGLNDPRIAVIVLKNKSGVVENDENAETAMNDKLLELGFSHVVDAAIVSRIYDAALLNSIYNGERNLSGNNGNMGADFLVLGKATPRSQNVQIPNYRGGNGYQSTMLNTGTAQLNVKVIKLATGEIVATYSVDAKGMGNSLEWAEDEALKQAAVLSANKLEEKFKKLQTNLIGGVQLNITCGNANKVDRIVEAIKAIHGVNGVVLREQNGSKYVFSIDTLQTPGSIVANLRRDRTLGVNVGGVTASSATISAN